MVFWVGSAQNTDQLLGERRAEGVQLVGALRGPVQQVADGDGGRRQAQN